MGCTCSMPPQRCHDPRAYGIQGQCNVDEALLLTVAFSET